MKWLPLSLKVLFCSLGVAAALLYGEYKQITQKIYPVNSELILQVKSGASLRNIADTLYENKLIGKPLYFILYCKINEIYPKIKAGEYLIDHDVTLPEIADILASGKMYLRKITFAEGITAGEAMKILADNEYLSGEFAEFADGEILPETYVFSRGDSRQKIINRAKADMENILQQAWAERDDNLPLNSKEEMLILASIVEKETGVASERPRVASVFINRLRQGMMLQTDPTVIYAITHGKTELKRPLTRKDLQVDSLYNTYKYAGLPPTPICNPGRESLMAVAHPDKTQYLYFVASGDGGHNFAKTLKEHNANVQAWRKHKN